MYPIVTIMTSRANEPNRLQPFGEEGFALLRRLIPKMAESLPLLVPSEHETSASSHVRIGSGPDHGAFPPRKGRCPGAGLGAARRRSRRRVRSLLFRPGPGGRDPIPPGLPAFLGRNR